MSKNILKFTVTVLMLAATFFSCNKKPVLPEVEVEVCATAIEDHDHDYCLSILHTVNDESCEIYDNKWKLMRVFNEVTGECFDYSKCNIVVEFNLTNMTVTVSGEIIHKIFDGCFWGSGVSFDSSSSYTHFLDFFVGTNRYIYRYRYRVNSNELLIDEYRGSHPFIKGDAYYFIKL